MPTAIEFENISKQYRLGLVSTRTLSHDLKRWYAMNIQGKDDPYLKIGEVNDRAHRGESEYVWALKDINFKVEQGDVLGIIGKNGAGKSTLLKILSKVTTPSTGTIKARGRIASLLEVGTGFHPEMTGRENIYMNGAIMGMTKAEISRKFDEIVDFSGVERYIDTPAKRYSSGMTVRLGFAIAAHLDPEILVVDEVLAVGDAEFQKKAIGKMQDVSKGEGRTVLFVSHNMASMQQLCNKGMLLENGMIKMTGRMSTVIENYISANSLLLTSSRSWSIENGPGASDIRLTKLCLKNRNNQNVDFLYVTDDIVICFEYEVLNDIEEFTHSINLFNQEGVHVFTSHDSNEYCSTNKVIKGKYSSLLIIPGNLLHEGDYTLSFACMRYIPYTVIFHEMDLIKIHLEESIIGSARPKNYTDVLPGIVRPKLNWKKRIKIS